MQQKRRYSIFDQFCLGLDQAVRAVFGQSKTTERPYPAEKTAETKMTTAELRHAAALMRVNHTGEVCAQALYHGQGCVSTRTDVKIKMQQAAIEEGDHLIWCNRRIVELGSHTSYLNPLWYAGSFAIGITAGLIGDKWSLGFLAETEAQVIKHLESHVALLPKDDQRSRVILEKMRMDEAVHRDEAIQAGALILPLWTKKLMRLTSKVMVKIAFWI